MTRLVSPSHHQNNIVWRAGWSEEAVAQGRTRYRNTSSVKRKHRTKGALSIVIIIFFPTCFLVVNYICGDASECGYAYQRCGWYVSVYYTVPLMRFRSSSSTPQPDLSGLFRTHLSNQWLATIGMVQRTEWRTWKVW